MQKIRFSQTNLISLCFGLMVLVASIHTWTDPDIWGHLYRGGLIRQTGQVSPRLNFDPSVLSPINHYWLFQILVSFVYQSLGSWGITALFTLVWGTIFALLAHLVGARRYGTLAWGWILGAFLVCEIRFFERPEAFGFLSLLFCLCLIRRSDGKAASGKTFARLFGPLVIVQIFLANLHGYFALIPAVVLLKSVSEILDRKGSKRWSQASHYAILAVILTLVSGMTPYGFQPWIRVFLQSQELNSVRLSISEMQSFSFATLQTFSFAIYALFWTLTLGAFGGILLLRSNISVFPLILAVGGLLLSFTTLRMASFLFYLSAPVWREVFDEISERRKSLFGPGGDRFANGVLAFVILGFTFGFAHGDFYRARDIVKEFGSGPARWVPKSLSQYLKDHPASGKMFNSISEGSYLKFENPKLPLFSDSIINGTAKIQDYFTALNNFPAFQAFQNEHLFEHVIVTPEGNAELFIGLLRTGDWHVAYADLHYALLSKTKANSNQESFHLFNGENLTDHYHGRSAALWAKLLVDVDRGDLLTRYFEELALAPAIPAPLLDFSLAYFQHYTDPRLQGLARQLRPKLFSVQPGDLAGIDKQMRGFSPPVL